MKQEIKQTLDTEVKISLKYVILGTALVVTAFWSIIRKGI